MYQHIQHILREYDFMNDEFPECLLESDEFKRKLVSIHYTSLKYASDTFRSNRKLMEYFVEKDEKSVCYISNTLRSDRKFMLEMIKKSTYGIFFISREFRKDKEFLLKAAKSCDYTIYFAESYLQDDQNFLLDMIHENDKTFDYLLFKKNNTLKDDFSFLKKAVEKNSFVFPKLSNKFIFSPNYGLKLVEKNHKLLDYLPEEKSTSLMKIIIFRNLYKVNSGGKYLPLEIMHYIISFLH